MVAAVLLDVVNKIKSSFGAEKFETPLVVFCSLAHHDANVPMMPKIPLAGMRLSRVSRKDKKLYSLALCRLFGGDGHFKNLYVNLQVRRLNVLNSVAIWSHCPHTMDTASRLCHALFQRTITSFQSSSPKSLGRPLQPPSNISINHYRQIAFIELPKSSTSINDDNTI